MEYNWDALISALREEKGLRFEPGLTDPEVVRTEETFGFRFPPDLRAFLQTALPYSGPAFPNWRSESEEELRATLSWPLEGFLFDVEHNEFWLPEWGLRPMELEEAFKVVRTQFQAVPKLIPIYGHRYMPEQPHSSGNPVFSVHQTDVIWYGFDLDDYFRHEFNLLPRAEWPTEVRHISFWERLCLRDWE